jgi:hypothetical protein
VNAQAPAASLLPLAVVLLLPACSAPAGPPLGTWGGAAPVTLLVEEGAGWAEEDPGDAPLRAAALPAAAALHAPEPAPQAPAAPWIRTPLPGRRVTRETPRGTPPTKGIEALAQERFLDLPTVLRAERVTLTLPLRLAPLIRLTGESVGETRPGRRVATGRARLLLRELTVEAERITVRLSDDSPDLHATAYGGVSFASDQRGQVFREEGARGLVLHNDQVTPIR